MQIAKERLSILVTPFEKISKITYTDGGAAYVFKKARLGVQNAPPKRRTFPPVNRNEPMTKTAYRRTLNRYFERLITLDLDPQKCLSLTLTIRSEQYNSYEKICDRFKHFINEIRFSKKVGNSYVGTVRFIEVQEKGFFHIHCILVFDKPNIELTWKDLHRMWGWGFVKVTAVYYFLGLIDYLANPKHGAESKFNSEFTRYPKGAKIIYISPNLPIGKSENVSITAEEWTALLHSEDCIGHVKFHKYFDYEVEKSRIAIDKMVVVQISQKEVEYKK